jgi:hypothetical protein
LTMLSASLAVTILFNRVLNCINNFRNNTINLSPA